eukprot:4876962-Prymnesium_polylepis.1
MPARKKSRRGDNLGDAREVPRVKADVDGDSSGNDRADPDFLPEQEPPSPRAGCITPTADDT